MSIIKSKREEKSLTQKEVAELLGLSQPAYYKIENGQTKLKGQLKKKVMQILNLKESEFPAANSEEMFQNQYQQVLEDNEKLKVDLKNKNEILSFLIDLMELSDNKIDYFSNLWMYVQDRNRIKLPEKYNKIEEWKEENQHLILESFHKGIPLEEFYPSHIKKLEKELHKVLDYYIEKTIYESNIFMFLKENRLLKKTDLDNYNKFRKINIKKD